MILYASGGGGSSMMAVEFESKANCEAAATVISGGQKFGRGGYGPFMKGTHHIGLAAECFAK